MMPDARGSEGAIDISPLRVHGCKLAHKTPSGRPWFHEGPESTSRFRGELDSRCLTLPSPRLVLALIYIDLSIRMSVIFWGGAEHSCWMLVEQIPGKGIGMMWNLLYLASRTVGVAS